MGHSGGACRPEKCPSRYTDIMIFHYKVLKLNKLNTTVFSLCHVNLYVLLLLLLLLPHWGTSVPTDPLGYSTKRKFLAWLLRVVLAEWSPALRLWRLSWEQPATDDSVSINDLFHLVVTQAAKEIASTAQFHPIDTTRYHYDSARPRIMTFRLSSYPSMLRTTV